MKTKTQIVFLLLFSCTFISAQTYNYYFGNIHSHTGFSDGNKDSLSSGVSGPSGSYAYAKLSDDFDFLGISEHNHYSSNKNPGFKLPRYQQGLNMADDANADGSFVALYGMEYGVSSAYNGHILVYGFDELIGWETGVGGMTGNNYNVFNAKSDYAGLFSKIKNKPGAFCYLAHPAFDNYSTGGSWESALVNAPYNAAFDSAIVGMPLRNGLATSAVANYTDYPQSHFFNYYKKMLYQGYHLGIGYDHDNHYTNFGRGNGGRLVILAPALSRAEFYKAMHAMRFYGSDDSNARIGFTLNDSVMGSILTGATYPLLRVTHNDADGEEADTIKIWRGNKNSGGLWAQIIHSRVGSNSTTFQDQELVSGKEYFYFAEIRQKDGQWIVTSPIWYNTLAPLGVKKHENPIAEMYYHQAGEKLEISVLGDSATEINITDTGGKTVLNTKSNNREFSVEVSHLDPGMYLVKIISGGKSAYQKVVIY